MSSPVAPLERVTRLAAHVVAQDDAGRILLCRISEDIAHRGRWTLPGGGIEFGETPEVAAVREFAEETGLTVELGRVLTTFSYVVSESVSFGGRPLHWVSIVYRGRVTGGSMRDEVEGSTDRCGWFTMAEAGALPLVELAERGLGLAFQAD
jgi:8-oxo-dGTP diphosphatase